MPGESVLEIGTGSGYLAALMASRNARVTSVEIDARLSADAKPKLARAGLQVELAVGDGARGWGTQHLRCDRADRVDADPSGQLRQAIEARRADLRGRWRSAGDDGADRALGGSRLGDRAGPLRDRDRTAQERCGAIAVHDFDSATRAGRASKLADGPDAHPAGADRRARAVGVRLLPDRGLAADSARRARSAHGRAARRAAARDGLSPRQPQLVRGGDAAAKRGSPKCTTCVVASSNGQPRSSRRWNAINLEQNRIDDGMHMKTRPLVALALAPRSGQFLSRRLRAGRI